MKYVMSWTDAPTLITNLDIFGSFSMLIFVLRFSSNKSFSIHRLTHVATHVLLFLLFLLIFERSLGEWTADLVLLDLYNLSQYNISHCIIKWSIVYVLTVMGKHIPE
jgi:hypothetical protein